MRILHVISGIEPENGGPTVVVTGLSRALKAAGCDVALVATWKSRSAFSVADGLKADGIDAEIVGPTRRPFRTHPDLTATLRRQIAMADVVHVHAVWEEIEHRTAVLASEMQKPYLWTPHGMLDRWNMRRNGWFKRAMLWARVRGDLNAAAAVHAASEFEKNQIARLGLRVPTRVAGFGVDAALRSPPQRGAFRLQWKIGPETPVVLFLGRIQHGKGVDVLVRAMARVTTPEARLVIAGPSEGPLAEAIRRDIRALGLADRVLFTGMLSRADAVQAARDADVLAAPSAHENFGIAVAEALTLGTPVVVSDQVGLAAFVEQQNLGRVTAIDPTAIAAAIDSLLSDADALRATSERCAAVGRRSFDWSVLSGEWSRLYADLPALRDDSMKRW